MSRPRRSRSSSRWSRPSRCPRPVDVNGDTLEKLETLPGIGPALAKEIVAARPHAGYESIAKLKGIGTEKLDALKGRLKFGETAAVAKAKEKAKAKVDETKSEVAEAKTKVAEAKEGMPKAKAKVDEAKAKVKAAEAKAEEKVAPKVAEAKEKVKLAPGTKININTAEQGRTRRTLRHRRGQVPGDPRLPQGERQVREDRGHHEGERDQGRRVRQDQGHDHGQVSGQRRTTR